jgi:hypothetical protein
MALLLAAVLLQEKVKLELQAHVGEKSVHTRRESNTGRILITLAGQKVTENLLDVETRRHRDEVLEVDGPVPVRVRRTIEEWSESKEKGGETVKAVKKLQGRTIVLKRNAEGGTDVEGAEGIPAGEIGRQRLRPDILFGAFPAEPMAVGQEWGIEEKALLKDFKETSQDDAARFTAAKGVAKLEKLEDHKGARCAVVLVSVKASGTIKGQDALKSSFDLRTRVWLDVAKGRVLTMKGEGEGKIEGTLDQEGEKMTLDGTFTLSIEADQTYE